MRQIINSTMVAQFLRGKSGTVYICFFLFFIFFFSSLTFENCRRVVTRKNSLGQERQGGLTVRVARRDEYDIFHFLAVCFRLEREGNVQKELELDYIKHTTIQEMSIEEIPQGAEVTIIPKAEKKAKDALLKLGLKPLKDISRVTFRKKNNTILAIEKPEVYRTQGGSYVVFGEAKVEDLTKRYQEAMAAQEAAKEVNNAVNAPKEDDLATSIQKDLAAASLEDKKAEAEDDGEEVDATGLEESDITVVMEQTNTTRNKAVKALKENKGDIVNAIMSLS